MLQKLITFTDDSSSTIHILSNTWYKVSRLRLYKMRVLKYYVENKVQLETWK